MIPEGVSGKCLRTSSAICESGDLAGPLGVDVDADRLGDADGVGELDLAALGQARGDDVLGDVAGHVGGRAVDLRGVLAAEGAAAVPAHGRRRCRR